MKIDKFSQLMQIQENNPDLEESKHSQEPVEYIQQPTVFNSGSKMRKSRTHRFPKNPKSKARSLQSLFHPVT
jgi:hypothetical protein